MLLNRIGKKRWIIIIIHFTISFHVSVFIRRFHRKLITSKNVLSDIADDIITRAYCSAHGLFIVFQTIRCFLLLCEVYIIRRYTVQTERIIFGTRITVAGKNGDTVRTYCMVHIQFILYGLEHLFPQYLTVYFGLAQSTLQ